MKTIGPIFIALVILSSCKKEKTTPQSSSGYGSSSSYYGVMYSNKFEVLKSGTLTSAGGANGAYFSDKPLFSNTYTSEAYQGGTRDAGMVMINNAVLQKTVTAGNYFYKDHTTLFNLPHHWVVTGGNGVSHIDYIFFTERPTYAGYASLPDTIKLSHSNNLSLDGISGADEIVVRIFAGNDTLTRNLDGNSTIVTLNSDDLIGLPASTNGTLTVTCSKNSYKLFEGRNYKCKAGYELFKEVVIQ